jgi:hypothetical protein
MDPLPTKREQKFIFKELDALSGPDILSSGKR